MSFLVWSLALRADSEVQALGTAQSGHDEITYVYFHLFVKIIIHYQGMAHAYTCRLHPGAIRHFRTGGIAFPLRMTWTIMEATNF